MNDAARFAHCCDTVARWVKLPPRVDRATADEMWNLRDALWRIVDASPGAPRRRPGPSRSIVDPWSGDVCQCPRCWEARRRANLDRLQRACPGHVASADDPKRCGRCGIHIDDLRPDDEDSF